MFNYYLIRKNDFLQFVPSAELPSNLPCEVIGFSSFSAPLSEIEISGFNDVIND